MYCLPSCCLISISCLAAHHSFACVGHARICCCGSKQAFDSDNDGAIDSTELSALLQSGQISGADMPLRRACARQPRTVSHAAHRLGTSLAADGVRDGPLCADQAAVMFLPQRRARGAMCPRGLQPSVAMRSTEQGLADSPSHSLRIACASDPSAAVGRRGGRARSLLGRDGASGPLAHDDPSTQCRLRTPQHARL